MSTIKATENKIAYTLKTISEKDEKISELKEEINALKQYVTTLEENLRKEKLL